jgi:hypothetical protein
MKTENFCPVCGYEMNAPPRDFRICSSCGTEFGLNDVNASIAELRDAWFSSGPEWWSKTTAKPENWNALDQMEKAGIVIKRQPASELSFISTSSSTALVAGQDWTGWAAAPVQSSGIQLVTGSH